jgi:hypothetical protein
MDAEQLGVGKLIRVEHQRDAIHVAIAPVVAAHALRPGQHVGLDDNGEASGSSTVNPIGIVDPYLAGGPRKGDRFWLFLYPGSITSLRHDWTHPAVEAIGKSKKASEEWLRAFAQNNNCPSYEVLIVAASGGELPNTDEEYYDRAYSNDGEYLHFNGWDAHSEIPPEFWDHVEVVSGKKIPRNQRARSFSCSC